MAKIPTAQTFRMSLTPVPQEARRCWHRTAWLGHACGSGCSVVGENTKFGGVATTDEGSRGHEGNVRGPAGAGDAMYVYMSARGEPVDFSAPPRAAPCHALCRNGGDSVRLARVPGEDSAPRQLVLPTQPRDGDILRARAAVPMSAGAPRRSLAALFACVWSLNVLGRSGCPRPCPAVGQACHTAAADAFGDGVCLGCTPF